MYVFRWANCFPPIGYKNTTYFTNLAIILPFFLPCKWQFDCFFASNVDFLAFLFVLLPFFCNFAP